MMVHWIWFATRPSINERVKVHLLQQFGDPEAVYFAADSVYDGIDGLSLDGKTALQDKNLREAEEILQKCQRDGIQILTYQDAAYPNRLKNIPDPPVVLYYLGRLPDLTAHRLSVWWVPERRQPMVWVLRNGWVTRLPAAAVL